MIARRRGALCREEASNPKANLLYKVLKGKLDNGRRPKPCGLVLLVGILVLCIIALFTVVLRLQEMPPVALTFPTMMTLPSTSTSTSSITPPRFPPFEMVDAGIYPPRSCQGIKQVRQAWTAFASSDIADEAETNNLNAFHRVTCEHGNDAR